MGVWGSKLRPNLVTHTFRWSWGPREPSELECMLTTGLRERARVTLRTPSPPQSAYTRVQSLCVTGMELAVSAPPMPVVQGLPWGVYHVQGAVKPCTKIVTCLDLPPPSSDIHSTHSIPTSVSTPHTGVAQMTITLDIDVIHYTRGWEWCPWVSLLPRWTGQSTGTTKAGQCATLI